MRPPLSSLRSRIVHFWLVWTALLLIHEGGHALAARSQGLEVSRVTVGVGPVLWRGDVLGTEGVLRLVPLAGMTTLADADAARHVGLAHHAAVLAGGVLATLLLAIAVALAVAARERTARRSLVWGRILVADAVVLTVLNFLPVPPLDGGRAMVELVAAWRGAPLPSDALFWVQLGGLASAIVPMTLWTRWTARIDAAALSWKAPRPA